MNKNELKEGEIYKVKLKNSISLTYIMKATKDLKNVKNIPSYNSFMKEGNFNNDNNIFEIATPEEKHYLETCIKADKFVSYEKAMKTFIPEYVECIKEEKHHEFYGDLGKIYKVSDWNYSQYDCWLEGTTSCSTAKNRFKSSTKEAYDAQFKTKEIVKVKPFDILSVFSKINDTILELQKDGYYRDLKNNTSAYLNPSDIIKVNSLYKINSAINEEGNIFMIGDIITQTITDSPNKGKGFKITGFRLNNDKSMICAITDTHTPYGIGIDKIEHFIEKDIFVLPEKWKIKINIENLDILSKYFHSISENYLGYIKSWKVSIDTLMVYPQMEKYRWGYYGLVNKPEFNNYTEISFDQFKKYVLKEEELSPIQLANIQHPELSIDYKSIVVAKDHVNQLKLKQVGIDSIVIPNETLLEKAKRLYPVGTKFRISHIPHMIVTVKSHDHHYDCEGIKGHINLLVEEKLEGCKTASVWSNSHGWAEIIEDKPKIGDKFRFRKHDRGEFTIDRIEDSNDDKIIFYNQHQTHNRNWNRVLLKNIKIIK